MRILNLFFFVLFLASAALQYNDPDPYWWIPLYLLGAFICFHAFRGRMIPALYILGWLLYLPYALFLFLGADGVLSWWLEHDAENIAQGMKAAKPWIEATREFFGLLLLIISLTLNWFWLRRPKMKKETCIAA